jgi:methionine synthase II (cobalamin-independent)
LKKKGQKFKTAARGPIPEEMSNQKGRYFLLSLLTVTFLAYLPALTAHFVNWDDPLYVTDSPWIRLSIENIMALFFPFPGKVNLPLTRLSLSLNHAVSGIPPEHMRLHLCWGNYEGPHHRDVELKDIVETVLTARPSGLSFVAANPRHEHEWKVWEGIQIPDDKILIPGVVDSTTNFIEHPELIAERLLRFARFVGADRVMAGTDCGFSTFAGMHIVDPAIVWAKLGALVEGARLASGAVRLGLSRPQLVARA